MSKILVIVESPSKAKTINKYLGKDYMVKPSIGHIRDLPISSSTSKTMTNFNRKIKGKLDPQHALVNRMGIDPFHGWKAKYEILPGKEKIVTEIKALAEKVDHIYLATDLDREGEAIAWHLREIIGGDIKRFTRVVFNEITLKAITQAFKQPVELNIHRVNAQQARRFMDRIVGYMISPLLWKKIARGLSAGRVQSVAVKLVVEREREIKSFIPKEYWELYASLQTEESIPLLIHVTHQQNKPFKPISYHQIKTSMDYLKNANYIVSNLDIKSKKSKPNAPFTTSTLQQAANIKLGYSVKKTMFLAQQLYEAGYITYIRTDSTSLSKDAINMARNYISTSLGILYLPKQPNEYISKNNSMEAHEAIRPSDINIFSQNLKDMTTEAQKLYQLIWRQFIACQMKSAQYDCAKITVIAGEFQLNAYSRILRFDGWTKIIPDLCKGNKDVNLSMIKKGETMMLSKLIPVQHFTKPPARYRESSLVKELEKRGIGRPSTYVSIISTIQDRGYVRVENHRFYAEKIGEIVTDCLESNFHDLMNYDFTANMENTLDKIAANHQEWKSVLDNFFIKFNNQLKNAEKDPEYGGMRLNQMVMTTIDCSVCNRKMGVRIASTGVFLGCSGYYAIHLKERCKNTIHLIPEAEVINVLDGDDAEANALRARYRCEKCGTAMDSYIIDIQHKLHICGNSPICYGYKIEQGKFRIKGYDGQIIECEKCGADMCLKLGRFSKYMDCTNNDCKNTRKILRNGNVAPPKEDPVPLPELPCDQLGSYFVLHDGAAGIFLASNIFPKSRETRAPLVSELTRFRNRLPKKFRYLADAPIKDDEGNSTIVRFSRKTKQQYISSKKNGKITNWAAFYINGKWQVTKE